jgi:hypothetical protein
MKCVFLYLVTIQRLKMTFTGNEHYLGKMEIILYCSLIYSIESLNVYDCSVCSLPICDQLVFRVNENYFHSSCLNCSECHMQLLDKCYTQNGSVYCKEDFFK